MSYKPNPIALRSTFESAVDLMRQNGIDASKARLTQSYIRSEVLANTNSNQYTFPLIVNQPDTLNPTTAQKLQLQDALLVDSLGIFVAAPGSPTGTAFQLLTYGDPEILTAVGAADAVATIYNGKLQVTANNSVIVPAWDVLRCKVIPRTQTDLQSTPTLANSSDFSVDGFFPVEPNLVISGAANYQVVLQLPSALAAVQSNQRIILIARGLLAQNVTTVQ